MYLHPAPLDRSYSLREFDILNGILPIFSNPHINSMTYETLNQAYGFPLRWYFLVQVTSIMGKHLWFLNPHQWHFEGIPNNYYQTKPPFRGTAAEVANRINGIKKSHDFLNSMGLHIDEETGICGSQCRITYPPLKKHSWLGHHPEIHGPKHLHVPLLWSFAEGIQFRLRRHFHGVGIQVRREREVGWRVMVATLLTFDITLPKKNVSNTHSLKLT